MKYKGSYNVQMINMMLLTCCPWSHGLRPKKLSVSVAVPPAPVRVSSQSPLAPSVASVTLVANDKVDNEIRVRQMYVNVVMTVFTYYQIIKITLTITHLSADLRSWH